MNVLLNPIVLKSITSDPIIMKSIIPPLLFFGGYLLLSAIFFIFDSYIITKNEQIFKYKIQKKRVPIDEYKKVLPTVFRNLTITTIANIIACFIMFKYVPKMQLLQKYNLNN